MESTSAGRSEIMKQHELHAAAKSSFEKFVAGGGDETKTPTDRPLSRNAVLEIVAHYRYQIIINYRSGKKVERLVNEMEKKIYAL
jgi:hypothetical protein